MFSRAERPRTRLVAAAVAATAISLTTCGENEPTTTTSSAPQRLTRPDLAMIEDTKLAVERYCIGAANRVRDTGAAPPAARAPIEQGTFASLSC